MHTVSGILLALILLAICLILYFLPTIIARKRNHRNLTAIFILNLFLGWMLIGWVGALVWAVLNSADQTGADNRPSSSPRSRQESENAWAAKMNDKITRYAENYTEQIAQKDAPPSSSVSFGRRGG